MRGKRKILMTLGSVTFLIQLLSVPSSWKAWVTGILGVGIVFVAYRLQEEFFSKKEQTESVYVENGHMEQDTIEFQKIDEKE